jgi:uncharacterized protein YlxP (DUF503 family)
MTAGALRVEFLVPGAMSLKDKRRAVRSLKDRMRHRFNVSVAEIDHQELWRRAALGVAAVGTEGRFVRRVLDEVLDFLRRDRRIEVVSHETETY